MTCVLVVAPHPDDETLGCGGALLRHVKSRDEVHWCIVTGMTGENYPKKQKEERQNEIKKVTKAYGFKSVSQLGFAAAELDTVAMADLVEKLKTVFRKLNPEIIYMPFPGDIHSDHELVFQATSACTKWFRQESVRRILCYEVLSETDFQINPVQSSFRPNVFIDISQFLDQKIEIMKIFKNEIQKFPFPRSEEAIVAQAKLRGAASGLKAAEAFQLIKEII